VTTTRAPRGPSLPELARLFHALSDETRLKILDCLRGGEECVCDLTQILDAGQSRLSFHLKTMKEAGLVRDRKEGRFMHYALEPAALTVLESFVDALRRSPACCSPATDTPASPETASSRLPVRPTGRR